MSAIKMLRRIYAAITNNYASLVQLPFDEENHGTATVLLAECLRLELPCTLAEMVGEIKRLQSIESESVAGDREGGAK